MIPIIRSDGEGLAAAFPNHSTCRRDRTIVACFCRDFILFVSDNGNLPVTASKAVDDIAIQISHFNVRNFHIVSRFILSIIGNLEGQGDHTTVFSMQLLAI